jgi:hypothetical protein
MSDVARPDRGWKIVLAVVIAVAAALPSGGATAADSTPDGGTPQRSDVRTLDGTITAVARLERAVTIETDGGTVKLIVDRNTSVFLPSRLATIRELTVGTQVRASYGPDRRAFWIEVRPPATPGKRESAGSSALGTAGGPPVLPAPRAREEGVPAAPPESSDHSATAGPTTEVPAGPGSPEPNPGATPTPPPPPGGRGAE